MQSNGGYIASQIRHLGNRIFEKMLRDSGVEAFSGAQGRILYVLWEHGPLTITQIGKMTALAKSTLTSMLDTMERGGVIVRTPDPASRKQTIIRITERATAYRAQYEDISRRMTDLTYQGFSEAEIAQYESMLMRILHNLEAYQEEEP